MKIKSWGHQISSQGNRYFRPPSWPGLEGLVIFPDGEFRHESLPNSSVWVFSKQNHQFRPEIHQEDLGCGMTAILIPPVDKREAADAFYDYLQGEGILGRGNHFVDLCSPIEPVHDFKSSLPSTEYQILLLHTHGRGRVIPSSLSAALEQQKNVAEERWEIGKDLIKLLGTKGELLADWPHNTVEETPDKIIYRKGAVKVEPGKIYFLPAHLQADILVYSHLEEKLPPYSSMPHGTGRRGPRGQTKVTAEQASLIRKQVYIPSGIKDSSLRTEHHSCYNGFDKIFDTLRKEELFVPVGYARILSYVGKV